MKSENLHKNPRKNKIICLQNINAASLLLQTFILQWTHEQKESQKKKKKQRSKILFKINTHVVRPSIYLYVSKVFEKKTV